MPRHVCYCMFFLSGELLLTIALATTISCQTIHFPSKHNLAQQKMSSPSLIEQAYAHGEIDINQLALYHAYALKDPGQLPEEYSSAVPEKCGTWIVNEIHRNWNNLSLSTKSSLMNLGWTPLGVLSRPTGLDSTRGTTHFLVHYSVVPVDTNAVSTFDGDANGTPDYVDTVLTTLEYVWNYETGTMGYTVPPSDAAAGGDDRYDVYIRKIALYGVTYPETDIGDNPNSTSVTESHAYISYLALRNNYVGFSTTGSAAIEVTAAHKFYHSIQDGYDAWVISWLKEATATWCEDEVYNLINDNYQYLHHIFSTPWIPLDAGAFNTDTYPSNHKYGSWIFFRYVSEHLVGNQYNIRRIIEHLLDYDNKNGDHSFDEIGAALAERGTNFTKVFREFTAANATLTIRPYRYSEGANYPMVARTAVESDTTIQDTLNRHASRYYQIAPAMLPSCAKTLKVTFSPIDIVAHFGAQVVLCKDGGATLIPFEKSLTLPADTAPDSLFIVVLNFDFPGTVRNYNIQVQSRPKGSAYTLTDLGKIGSYGSVNAVNNLGHAVGTLYSNFGGFSSFTPVKWIGGGIGYLGSDGSAFDINNNDEAVGFIRIPFGTHAYFWGPSGNASIDTVTAGQSGASAINDSGYAVGTAKFPFNGGTETNSQPFFWKNNQMTKLPLFADTNTLASTTLDINNQNQIIGLISASGGVHAALWSGGGGGPQDLGDFYPQRLNDAGQYVGHATFTVTFDGVTTSTGHPVLGSGGGYSDLGTPDQLIGQGIALGINNRGDVVGWTSTALGWHAFLYSHGAMQDLNSLLPFGTCWTLQSASAISDSGHIVGVGYPVSDGLLHGFLLTPTAPTGVADSKPERPLSFKLHQNYPNPFNPSTIINYQLPIDNWVMLKVYNLLGQEVAILVDSELQTGSYSVQFNAGNLSSGMYFYRLQSGSFTETKKLVLLK